MPFVCIALKGKGRCIMYGVHLFEYRGRFELLSNLKGDSWALTRPEVLALNKARALVALASFGPI